MTTKNFCLTAAPNGIGRLASVRYRLPLFAGLVVAYSIFGSGIAKAAEPIKDTGAMACVTDKWDVKEPEKGHKLVDAAMRCVLVPDDPAEPTISQDCVGNYEYMPDESWKGNGTCTDNYPGGQD